MDIPRCDEVIQFALLEAGRQDDFGDRELGPIHLLKYVYLADLEHAERHGGETFTGARWTFYNYGPWSPDVQDRIEPALNAIHAEKYLASSARLANDFARWRKTDDERHAALERRLPQAVVTAVRRNVRKYGKDTRELLHHVYATRPMRYTAPRNEIVFAVNDPNARDARAPVAPPPSARQQKRQREQLAKAKQSIKAKLLARRAARVARKLAGPPPRYDDVFVQGVQWLDELGSGGEAELDADAVFDESVWASDTRGEEIE